MVTSVQRFTSVLPGDPGSQIKPQNLSEAAEQFEAMFLRSMLQQMRNATDALNQDNPFNSKHQRMMRDLCDDSVATRLAAQRSCGIAQLIIAQLSPSQSDAVKNAPEMAALLAHPQQLTTPVIPSSQHGQE